MLKFLTHKLRSHSLNEESPHQKIEDEDHDSGTESDDEHADTEGPETSMDSSETEIDTFGGAETCSGRISTGLHHNYATAGTVSPYFLDSALPSDSDLNFDHHSSEEELEVINSSCCSAQQTPQQDQQLHNLQQNDLIQNLQNISSTSRHQVNTQHQLNSRHLHHNHLLNVNNTDSNEMNNSNRNNTSNTNNTSIARSRSASTLPEKRKWSQVTLDSTSSCSSVGPGPMRGGGSSSAAMVGMGGGRSDLSSGSSDEEVQGLLATTPVQFRTSPPRGAHRPGRSFSPPPKLFHYAASSNQDSLSPRKRHRHATSTPHAIQRPCLDFEKMQQLKARAVTAWRHSGDHGGELSVFCW